MTDRYISFCLITQVVLTGIQPQISQRGSNTWLLPQPSTDRLLDCRQYSTVLVKEYQTFQTIEEIVWESFEKKTVGKKTIFLSNFYNAAFKENRVLPSVFVSDKLSHSASWFIFHPLTSTLQQHVHTKTLGDVLSYPH